MKRWVGELLYFPFYPSSLPLVLYFALHPPFTLHPLLIRFNHFHPLCLLHITPTHYLHPLKASAFCNFPDISLHNTPSVTFSILSVNQLFFHLLGTAPSPYLSSSADFISLTTRHVKLIHLG